MMISKNQTITQKKNLKNKRIIPILNFKVNKLEDYQHLTNKEDIKQVVFDNLIVAVSEGLDKNKKDVNLFQLKNSNCFINLDKSKWKNTLVKAKDFFQN